MIVFQTAKRTGLYRTKMGRSALWAAGVAIAALANPAMATDTSDDADGAAVDGEIVVYARKRAENVQTIPIAVSVLSKDVIDDGNLDELNDFVDLVPNASFAQESDTSAEISIRGSGRNIGDEDQSVGLYRDGVYIGGLLFSTANFYDIAQVEILRGPQAGLYGRNAVGGALNVTSEKPGQEFGAYVDAQIGTKARYELRAAANLPVVAGKWSLRLAGLQLKQSHGFDYVINQDQYADAVETISVRLRSLFTPTNSLEFLTTVEYLNTDGGGGLLVVAPDAATGFLDPNQTVVVPGTLPTDTVHQMRNFRGVRKLDQIQAIQEINWRTEAGTATAVVSYRSADFVSRRDEDLTNFDVNEIGYDASQDSLFAEARFTSRDFGPFKFVAGLSYLNEDLQLNFDNRIGGAFAGAIGGANIADLYAGGVVTPGFSPIFGVPVGTPISDIGLTPFATGWGGFLGDTFPTQYINKQKLKSIAVFAEANVKLSEKVELWSNLRFSRDRKSIDFAQTFGIPSKCPIACPEIFALFFDGLDPVLFGAGQATFKRLSPGGGVNVQLTGDALVYAKVVTGFKAGGFNSIAGDVDDLPFEQETTIAYEVGAKTSWFDRRLTLNLNAFAQTRKNALLAVADPVMPINTLGVNAGRIENKGFEIELAARPATGLMFQAAFGFLDAKFKEFLVDDDDFAGNSVPRSPRYSLSAIASYTHPITTNLDAFAYASYRNAWRGYTDNDNFERMSNPEVVDIRVGVKGAAWKLSAYADNLFDNRYTVYESRPETGGRHTGVFSSGRTLGIQGIYNF